MDPSCDFHLISFNMHHLRGVLIYILLIKRRLYALIFLPFRCYFYQFFFLGSSCSVKKKNVNCCPASQPTKPWVYVGQIGSVWWAKLPLYEWSNKLLSKSNLVSPSNIMDLKPTSILRPKKKKKNNLLASIPSQWASALYAYWLAKQFPTHFVAIMASFSSWMIINILKIDWLLSWLSQKLKI